MNKKLTHISILVVLSVSGLICVSCSSLDRPATFSSHRNHGNKEVMTEKEEGEKEGEESIVTVKKSKLQNGIIKVIDKALDQIIALTDPEEAKRQGIESYEVGEAMDGLVKLKEIVNKVDQSTEQAEGAERAAIAAMVERLGRAESKESMAAIEDQIAKAKQEAQAKIKEVQAKRREIQEEATKRNAAPEQKKQAEVEKAKEERIELVIAIAEQDLALAELSILRARKVLLEKKDLLMAEKEGRVTGDEVRQLESDMQVTDIKTERLVDIGEKVESRIQEVRDQVGGALIEKLEKVEKQTGEVFRAAEKIGVTRKEIGAARSIMLDIRRTRGVRLIAKEAKQVAEKVIAQAAENTLNLSKKEREKAEQVINEARNAAFMARGEISEVKNIAQPEQETILYISLVESAAFEAIEAAKELQVALLAAEAIQKVLHKKNDTRSGF